MKLRTLIIDDEPIALEKLRTYVGKMPFLQLSEACSGGLEAMEYLSANDVDLIITDINMPDLSGMDFVKSLTSDPMVIFITAYQDYAVDSYRLSAVDYLLKPYGFADFQRAVSKAMTLYRLRHQDTPPPAPESREEGSIFVKTDYRYVRVMTGDILYIKGYGEYLQIYLANADTPLTTLSSFAAIRGKLPGGFLQVHRSYIVNMDRIGHVERARIVIGDTYIPIGDSYKAEFTDFLGRRSVGKSGK